MADKVLRYTNPALAIVGAIIAALLWVISSQLAPLSQALARHIENGEIHVPKSAIVAEDRDMERRTAANAERLARVEAKVDEALSGIREIKRAVQ